MFLSFQKITQALSNVSAVVRDVYFNLVTLLLNTTSTNGAQNKTFIDDSVNNFTITTNGDATQGSFTPFSQTGWSNFLPASGSFLTVPASSDFAPGTGDFTVDGWIFTSSNSLQTIWAQTVGGTNYFVIEANAPTNTIQLTSTASGSGTPIASAATLALNAWNYFCVSRTSGTVTVWCNGSAGTPTSNTNNLTNTTYVPTIGTYSHATTTNPLIGYLSNIRYIKGTALSGATIPTTPFATDTANQTLLTCQSNGFFDKNITVSAKAVTATGTPSVQSFSPFAPTSAYSTSAVGGSLFLDGNGDYLAFPTSNATLYPGTNQFTFDFWFYTANTAFQTLFSYGSTAGMLRVFCQDGGMQVWNGSSQLTAGNLNLIKYGGWNHAVVERNATNLVSYVNGTRDYNVANAVNFNAGSLQVGAESGGSFLAGYISGFSYIKGNATYAGATITIPTAPPSTSNTTACLLFTNAGIYDSAAKDDLITVGNASVSTAQSKFGNSSMFFDGTGDYLRLNRINNVTLVNAINNGNCTIEMWVYTANSSASLKCLIDTRSSQGTDTGYGIYQIANNVVIYGNGVKGNARASLTGNTWTHLAVSRSGTNNFVFLNGTLFNTFSYGNTLTSGNVTIASDVATSNAFTGYIEEVRITKGFNRYTANFTPTTTVFPVQ